MATNILFRRTLSPTVPSTTSVKGSPLTSSEIDGNFKSVKDAIDDILLNGIGSILARHSATATLGQTVFDLPFVYSPGTNNLLVFVNGSIVERNVDYVETTTQRITFTSGLELGQEVTFLTNISPSPGLTYAAAGVASYYLATNGVQTAFTLPVDVLSKNNTQIFNNGIYQAKDGYTVAGTALTFSEAPTAGHIEVNVISATAIGQTTADLVEYTPAGTGAVATDVQSKLRECVSVKDFGASPSATAAVNTAAIQNAVNYCISTGKELKIPGGGTYLVNAVGSGATPNINGGIVINGPLTIFMYGAKLKAETNSSSSYVVLNIRNASDVFVFGGEIEGDRATHTGVGGEQGHGVVITGSTDVRLQDLYVSNCWGDGVSVRTDGNAVNKRITLDNVTCDAARRNGLTVQRVDGFLAKGCRFINTNGTAPQSGVDLEPNPGEGASKNVIFQNCYFAANTTSDFIGGGGDGIENVLITNCTFADTVASGLIVSGATLCKNVEISNNAMSMRAGSGLGVTVGSGTNIKVLDNVVSRAGAYSADASAGLYADGTSTNVVFRGNQLSGFRQGIQIQAGTVTYLNIEGNEIVGCARGILTNSAANKITIKGNSFRDLTSYGMQATFVDSVISDNLFEDIDLRATLIGATNCVISNNVFNRVGTNDQANEPCLGFSVAADRCAVTNNVFYSATASQDAIRASIAPTTPSFFTGNIARYGSLADVFVLNASHVVGVNYAL